MHVCVCVCVYVCACVWCARVARETRPTYLAAHIMRACVVLRAGQSRLRRLEVPAERGHIVDRPRLAGAKSSGVESQSQRHEPPIRSAERSDF